MLEAVGGRYIQKEEREGMEQLNKEILYTNITNVHCIRVCVFGGEESREFENKCEKGKGKEGTGHLSASVINSPSPFVQG